MSKLKTKKRFNALIDARTYNKVSEFVRENELITTRLTPGTMLELGLNILFSELKKKTIRRHCRRIINYWWCYQ